MKEIDSDVHDFQAKMTKSMSSLMSAFNTGF